MKKRFVSVLCILAMLLSVFQPYGVLAQGYDASIDDISVVMDENKIYFDVAITAQEDARLVVALYDTDGNLIEMRKKNTRLGETISLDADEEAFSYKIMLWSKGNNLKPLCTAEGDATADIPVYDADTDYDKNAKFLSSLGIVNATDGYFDKENNFTRAEFACILCRLLDVADVANAFTKDNLYTDVESTHWAAGFINLLGQAGVIDVLEEGKFNPYDNISHDHAIAALVRALGYEPLADELGEYGKLAADLKITCGVDYTEYLKAGDVVNLVANSLKAPMLVPYGYNPETSDDYFAADGKNGREYETLLTDMGVYKVAGVITGLGYGEMEFVASEDCDELGLIVDDEVYFKTEDSSLDEYLYELVDVYIKNHEVMAVVPNENGKTLTILSDDVVSCSQSVIKYTSGGQTKVADIDIVTSRLNTQYADLDEIIEERDVIIKFIDNTCDGIYDAVLGTKYDYYTITGIDTKKDKIQLDGANVYLDYEETAATILCDDSGNKLTVSDFAENDFVAVAADDKRPYRYTEYIKIVRLTSTALKGTVDELIEDETYDYVVIEGKQYANMSDTDFEEGETYTFRLGLTGKIVFADIYEGVDAPTASGGAYSLSGSSGVSGGTVSGGSQSSPTPSIPATPAPSNEYVNNVKLLSAFGIISDIASPDTEVKRADFAVILCRAMNLEEEAQNYKNKNKFEDIDASHYASGAINLLAEKGIMKALTGKNFCPDTAMRYAHAIRSVVDALGYSPMAKAKGGYPLGYVITAKQLKALSGIESDYYLSGEMLACLMANILTIGHMEEIADGEYVISNGKTYLTNKDIYIATGVITDITDDAVSFEVQEDSEDNEFDRNSVYEFSIDDYSALDYMYMYVDAYVQKTGDGEYKLLLAVQSAMGKTIVINSNDIEPWGTDDRYIEYYADPENSNKTEIIKHNINTDSIIYNMKSGVLYLEELCEIYDANVVLVENTGDNYYDKAIVSKYLHGLVDFVDLEENIISVSGKAIELHPESQNIVEFLADVYGKKINLSDFEEGDFVAVITNYDTFTMVQKLNDSKVSGMIDERYQVIDEEYAVINETAYCISEESALELSVGDKGNFYIGKTGKIEAFEPDMSDYGTAYILDAELIEHSFSEDEWQIKLITKKNEIVTCDVTDNSNILFNRYFSDNSDAFGTADDNGSYLFANATDAQKANPARLISYRINAKGQIFEFEKLSSNGGTILDDDIYNANTKTIADVKLEDNAIVFDAISKIASDITILKENAKYSGYVLKDEKNKNSVVIITKEDIQDVEKGDLTATKTSFAIVTSVTHSDNYVNIDYVCNGADGTVKIGLSALMQGDISYDEITVGSVISFIADKTGNATDYAVIAVVNDDYKLIVSQEGLEAVSDADTEFVHGYIANKAYTPTSKGQIIKLDNGKSYYVDNTSTNQYTFDDSGRNIVIRTGDFMDHSEMDYYDEDYGYTSKVFVKLVDDMVTDIYGFYDEKEE